MLTTLLHKSSLASPYYIYAMSTPSTQSGVLVDVATLRTVVDLQTNILSCFRRFLLPSDSVHPCAPLSSTVPPSLSAHEGSNRDMTTDEQLSPSECTASTSRCVVVTPSAAQAASSSSNDSSTTLSGISRKRRQHLLKLNTRGRNKSFRKYWSTIEQLPASADLEIPPLSIPSSDLVPDEPLPETSGYDEFTSAGYKQQHSKAAGKAILCSWCHDRHTLRPPHQGAAPSRTSRQVRHWDHAPVHVSCAEAVSVA